MVVGGSMSVFSSGRVADFERCLPRVATESPRWKLGLGVVGIGGFADRDRDRDGSGFDRVSAGGEGARGAGSSDWGLSSRVGEGLKSIKDSPLRRLACCGRSTSVVMAGRAMGESITRGE